MRGGDARIRELGSVGAGTGAAVGKLRGREFAVKSGVGLAKQHLPQGAMLVALAVVNAFGDVIGEDGQVLAGTRDDDGSFIGTTQHAPHAADRAAHLPPRRAAREHDAGVPDDRRRPDQDRVRRSSRRWRTPGWRGRSTRSTPPPTVTSSSPSRAARAARRAADRGRGGSRADRRGDPRRLPSGDDGARASPRSRTWADDERERQSACTDGAERDGARRRRRDRSRMSRPDVEFVNPPTARRARAPATGIDGLRAGLERHAGRLRGAAVRLRAGDRPRRPSWSATRIVHGQGEGQRLRSSIPSRSASSSSLRDGRMIRYEWFAEPTRPPRAGTRTRHRGSRACELDAPPG